MSLGNFLVLLVAVGLAAVGQLILKHGMNIARADAHRTGRSLATAAATSPWILGGLVVFAVSALAWLLTLSRVPLNLAYPFNALGYIVILTASVLILNEKSNVWTWVGTACVAVGLVVIVVTAPSHGHSVGERPDAPQAHPGNSEIRGPA